MDINKYSILAAIEKYGSLSKTADALGYTQSNISHMVKNMESECGFPLLIRGTFPISLTPEAVSLLPYITKIAETEQEMINTIKDIKNQQSRSLHVGIPGCIQGKWIRELSVLFNKYNPKISISYTSASLTELNTSLLSGNLDCCILFGSISSHFYSLFLTEVPVLLVAPKNAVGIDPHAPVITASKTLPYLQSDSAIQHIIQQTYPKTDFHTLLSLPNDAAIIEMIKDSLGFSLLPCTGFSDSSKSLTIYKPEIPLTLDLYIATPSETRKRSSVTNFMALAANYFSIAD